MATYEMHDIPDTKLVRRADLNSDSSPSDSDSDSSSSPPNASQIQALLAKLHTHISSSFSLPSPSPPSPSPLPPPKDSDDDEIFEFHLFAHTTAPSWITLSDTIKGPYTLVAPRQVESYLATPTEGERAQFRAAAVSYDEVLARSREAWPGGAMGWRVVEGAKVSITLKSAKPNPAPKIKKKKCKVGKKNRIAKRTKERRVVQEEKERAEKEDRAAEKRRRLNKLKNARKRAKKGAAKEGGGEVIEEGEGV